MVQPADAQIEVETGTADTEKFDAEMAALGDDWQEGHLGLRVETRMRSISL